MARMAHSALSRGRSWSVDAGSNSATSRWIKGERYRELEELEEEAKGYLKEVKVLEVEILKQSAGLEKLVKRDAERVVKISELSRLLEKRPDEDGCEAENGEVEDSVVVDDLDDERAREELQEQLKLLEIDHADSGRTIEETRTTLEQKERELERLMAQHRVLCERITKEEKALHAIELEESMQQSVAVQHEMRSLGEDLGRLGRIMDCLPPGSDHHKQNPRRSVELKVYHGVTSRGTRTSVLRKSNESSPSSVNNRSTHSPSVLSSAARSKEPVEFEQREGSNRKRHKNSSFEQELDRLQEQRERLEGDAQAKQMLLESVVRMSNLSRDGDSGAVMSSSKTNAAPQMVLSPSSMFEGFEENLSPRPAKATSPGSSSVSSEISSEDTAVEKPQEHVPDSTSKRLSFEVASSSSMTSKSMLLPEGSSKSRVSPEMIGIETLERNGVPRQESFGSVPIGCRPDAVEEGLRTEGDVVQAEACLEVDAAMEVKEKRALVTGSINEIDRLEEEVGSWGDERGGEEGLLILGMDTTERVGFGNSVPRVEPAAVECVEELLATKRSRTERTVGSDHESTNEECVKETSDSSLHPVVPNVQEEIKTDGAFEPRVAQTEVSVPIQESSATRDEKEEHRIWRLNAESQILNLSSQLSLLHQKIERKVEMPEEVIKQVHLEPSPAASGQLSKQISVFGDEINELKQSMRRLEQNFLKEVESRSTAEHAVDHFRSICVEQTAKIENLRSRVTLMAKELDEQLNLRADLEGKLEKEAEERLKFEAQLMDLSEAVALTVISREKEQEAVGELVEQQKVLLGDQLEEAHKLRTLAEMRVMTLDKQAEQLEMVFDVAQNTRQDLKYQEKALKYGLQTLVQLVMLALVIFVWYRRVAEAVKDTLTPT